MNRSRTTIFLVTLFVCAAVNSGCARQVDEATFDANPVAKEWLGTKQAFLDQIKLSIDTIVAQIDVAETKVRDSGDLAKVREVAVIRKAFLEQNEIHSMLDRKKYDEIRQKAVEELTARKTKFITELLKSKQDAIAEQIDKEFTELSDPVMADSIARWTSAVTDYRKEVEQAKSLIMLQLGELEEKARQKADVDSVEHIKQERSVFDATGTVPKSVSAITYDSNRKKARERLEEINKQIVRALLLAKKDNEATSLAQELEVVDHARVEKAASSRANARSRWVNTSYNTYIKQIEGSKWQEFDNGTDKLRWNYKELDRTDSYVEMLLIERKQTVRFFADKAQFLKDGKWEWLSNGSWVNEK